MVSVLTSISPATRRRFRLAPGTVTYLYYAFNRMVGKAVDSDGDEVNDSREVYGYDGQHVTLKFAGTVNAGSPNLDETDLAARYLYGPAVDQVLAEERVHYDSGQYVTDHVLWMLSDQLGTVRDVAEYFGGGTVVQNHLQYDSFGNVTSQTNSAFTPTFSYTGRQFDADSGLYYYRARWYDSAVGRFVSEDPSGFAAGDANLYRYVGNSPTNATDPSGMGPVYPWSPGSQNADGGGYVRAFSGGGCLLYQACFAAGTPVRMADGGWKRIEEVRPGDRVMSACDARPEDDAEAKPVVEVYRNQPRRLLTIEIEGTAGSDAEVEMKTGTGSEPGSWASAETMATARCLSPLSSDAGGVATELEVGMIRATESHPFYVRDRGWTPANQLSPGDRLLGHDGRWRAVVRTTLGEQPEPVFNLQVADHHTYFVGTGAGDASALVHNVCDWSEMPRYAPPDPQGNPTGTAVAFADKDDKSPVQQDGPITRLPPVDTEGPITRLPPVNPDVPTRLPPVVKIDPITSADGSTIGGKVTVIGKDKSGSVSGSYDPKGGTTRIGATGPVGPAVVSGTVTIGKGGKVKGSGTITIPVPRGTIDITIGSDGKVGGNLTIDIPIGRKPRPKCPPSK